MSFYSNMNSNVHRGVYKIAEQATHEFESTRDAVASFINSNSRELTDSIKQLRPQFKTKNQT